MLPATFAALLAAGAPGPGSPVVAESAGAESAGAADLLVLDLKPVGVDEDEARVVDGLFAEAVGTAVKGWPAAARPKVATGNDIRTLITLEANKAAAGCNDAGCLAEIAGAFGAHYVVTGTLGKLGDERVLQVWLFDVGGSQTLERASVTAPSAGALTPRLGELAARVLHPLVPASVASSAAPAKPAGGDAPVLPGVLLVGGGGLAGVAGLAAVGAGVFALVLDDRLAAGSGATPSDKRQALDIGPPVVFTAAVAGGAAVVGLALAGAGALLGGS